MTIAREQIKGYWESPLTDFASFPVLLQRWVDKGLTDSPIVRERYRVLFLRNIFEDRK